MDETARLTQTAAKRLRAIQEFSSMGAGFSLAMRDLDIRGAGNLLGTQQSGHIATVGYALYCRLLEQAVRGLKAMPPAEPPPVNLDLPGAAWLPREYIVVPLHADTLADPDKLVASLRSLLALAPARDGKGPG